MKFVITLMVALGFFVSISACAIEMPELAIKSRCTACHRIDRKLVGPSWNDVAVRYGADADAEAKLIYKVSNGGRGVWGDSPMPSILRSGFASEDEIKTLVKFILSLKQPVNISSEKAVNESSNALTIDPSTECIAKIPSNKELQVLNGKILLDGSSAYSFEQLANQSAPSNRESKAIAIWAKEIKSCKDLGGNWRANIYPATLLQLFDKLYSDINFLAADLYVKKINYGGFAKGVVKADQEFSANIAVLTQKKREDEQATLNQKEVLAQQERRALQQQQQQQLQLQQQIQQEQALLRQQQMQQQRPAYIPPRATQSTCGWQGSQWVCNTAPTGIDWGLLNTHFGEELGRALQPR